MLMPSLPSEGDVVILQSTNESKSSEFIILGITGGNYHNGARIQ